VQSRLSGRNFSRLQYFPTCWILLASPERLSGIGALFGYALNHGRALAIGYNHGYFSEAIMATGKKKRRIARAWTTDDVKTLRRIAKDRLSGRQAAKKLGRSHGAVAQKASALGIRFRSINRARRKTA